MEERLASSLHMLYTSYSSSHASNAKSSLNLYATSFPMLFERQASFTSTLPACLKPPLRNRTNQLCHYSYMPPPHSPNLKEKGNVMLSSKVKRLLLCEPGPCKRHVYFIIINLYCVSFRKCIARKCFCSVAGCKKCILCIFCNLFQ